MSGWPLGKKRGRRPGRQECAYRYPNTQWPQCRRVARITVIINGKPRHFCDWHAPKETT